MLISITINLNVSMPRPIKRRPKNYRLPIGALCCVLIWFFWMVLNSQPKPMSATSAILTAQTHHLTGNLLSQKGQLFDYRQATPFNDSIRHKLHGALQYFALNVRSKKDYNTYAVVLLPREIQYQEFLGLAKLAQKEGFFLKMQGDSVLMGRTQ